MKNPLKMPKKVPDELIVEKIKQAIQKVRKYPHHL